MRNRKVDDVLAVPRRETRRDMLGDLIVSVRSGGQTLSAEDAQFLFAAQNEEAQRDRFDGAMYAKLWELIQYAPAHEATRRVAVMKVDDLQSLCRGQGVRFLLRNYPEMRADLLKRLADHPDAAVHDAVAHDLAGTDPPAAIAHWERALGCEPLSHELAEMIPHYLAGLATSEDLARYAVWDAGTGTTIWGAVIALAKRR